ncbi:hypothetical protein DIT68_06615 [Brumimicrobium oceani]|uniref:Uncharacterized protein n=1 Tax=Brumimicrobium oceani TaxID=2100725 RepID=A0A2U2XDD2_9FLAO|nr:hypothetical protein DIT68_06615 [Brumimicrobium oceani]
MNRIHPSLKGVFNQKSGFSIARMICYDLFPSIIRRQYFDNHYKTLNFTGKKIDFYNLRFKQLVLKFIERQTTSLKEDSFQSAIFLKFVQ